MRASWLLFGFLSGVAGAEPATVRGRLVVDATPAVHCGDLEVWTVLAFDVTPAPAAPKGVKVDARRLPVAVPCTELTRSQYGADAGTAGVLEKGRSYRLTLGAPATDGRWGRQLAWPARRIDEVGG